jgi:putative endonuclease
MKQPAVYIMANKPNGTIYVGVTSNLIKRAYLHRNSLLDGFSKKYACKSLVFFEIHETMESAILREKQLKAGSREKKVELIEVRNPSWTDLYPKKKFQGQPLQSCKFLKSD